MANRVLLSSEGLKVSKPGFDVLTTTDNNLAFNSDWTQISVYARTKITLPAGSDYGELAYTGSLSYTYTSADIAYGKTFANVPFVTFSLKLASESFTRQSSEMNKLTMDGKPVFVSGTAWRTKRLSIFAYNDHWNWSMSINYTSGAGPAEFDSAIVTATVWDIEI